MTREPPSLRQQIEAVEWAARHAEHEETRLRLEAAAETLKHLEFMKETLK